MKLVRFRRHLGWDNSTLSLLIALSGATIGAWYSVVDTTYRLHLWGSDRELVREVARAICRVARPQQITYDSIPHGLPKHLTLTFSERPNLIWPEENTLSADFGPVRPVRPALALSLRRARLARLSGKLSPGPERQ